MQLVTAGEKIRQRRRELGLSQEALARSSGVSRETIRRVEHNAQQAVSTHTLTDLALALQTTVGALFFNEDA